MKQGDLVTRQSYGHDVLFAIEALTDRVAWLRGITSRLFADAPIGDLAPAGEAQYRQAEDSLRAEMSRSVRKLGSRMPDQEQETPGRRRGKGRRDQAAYFEFPGRVLHLDGDPRYLQKSMELYKLLNVPAHGGYVPEASMASMLERWLPEIKPDILVITGHDGLLKNRQGRDMMDLNNYKNSRHFVQAVRTARQFERNRDALIIVAGACQSHFEALLLAGANFASSPGRVMIHALDPLYVAAKTAYTSIRETVHISDVLHHTHSGIEGVGGVETKGCYRLGLPRLKQPGEASS
ncbi:peptidase [Paenibacillus sp. J31TS4]|uniref:sporulation peptidase YabG n=1 Tax=Paenibacillus sp. J31TS4 TaxID=2807195 RepID=UPI001B223A3E|nr:sporulation peptidase YabG [Paenibacillus sp. J31TS4]GIP41366.1 peptidase [Paenibacillus sp. J31TS4]